MKKTQVVGLSESLFKMTKQVTNYWVGEQNARLISYAREKVKEIGEYIKSAPTVRHMDRTGNLLDSLCWGVSYNGRLIQWGFYREKRASKDSYLHEWFSRKHGDWRELFPVDGHRFAQDYINEYGNKSHEGWRVFFAILAPYWGYWEKGFILRPYFGDGKARFLQFAVMTYFYDQVRNDLKPARTRFRVKVYKYDHQALQKRADKYYDNKIKDMYKYGNTVTPRRRKK